ncbi:hypothetical protein, partial [Mycoplasmopsis arginini]|uniref:hypothetical protein n=1 Tax=Mycoplasmopsis arginini TaxID=2094 RepID=UPI00249E5509
MRYPLWGMGQTGKSMSVTAESYTNMYAEISDDEDKTKIAFYGRHGLDLFISLGDYPTRGAADLNDLLYVVNRNTFYEINNAGTVTNRGTLLTTEGRVSIATNGNLFQIVDGTYGYVYNATTLAFTQITDADFVPAKTNTWIDGYFITDQLGSTDKTKLNRYAWSTDGLTYDALDFASAESSHDPLVRVFNDNRELILFGQFTTEFHGSNGSLDQPFSRQATIEWGLAARHSVAKMNDSMIYLARNRMGKTQVLTLNGYSPEVVSNKSMSTVIDSYGDISNATGFSFMEGGHPFYILSFPNVGKSWMFDGSTSLWSKVNYGLTETQYRGAFGTGFISRVVVFDYANGNIYNINPDAYFDNGSVIVGELASRHIFDTDYIAIYKCQIDMEAGVGLSSGQGANPQIMLQVSHDGGKTYGNEMWESFGAIGNYS